MALSALFKPGTKSVLERIEARDFTTPEEKKALYTELAQSKDVKTADVTRLLFTPDADLRKAAGACLAARRDPETFRHFVAALNGRPEAARRAALNELVTLPLGSVPAQFAALLAQPDPALRKLAGEAILELPHTPETFPVLAKVLECGDAPLRLKAAGRLAGVATERDLALFEKLTGDPDERIRLHAYQTLVRFAGPGHLGLLLAKVAEETYAGQQVIVQGIQRLLPDAGPEAVDAVLGLLVSGATGLRTAALKILLALPDRVGTIRRFISFSHTLAGWVRERALASMREFGPDVLDPALGLLADPDPEMRAAALTLVAAFEDRRVAEAVVPLLQDPDWWLAINAADLLGRLAYAPATAALIAALDREEVRWAAVDALGLIGSAPAIAALTKLINDPRGEIRIEAIQALGKSGDASVLPALSEVADRDPAKWVRGRALEAIQKVNARIGAGVASEAVAPVCGAPIQASAPEIHRLLARARSHGASDLHVSVDMPPVLRVHGLLTRVDGEPFTGDRTAQLLLPLLTADQRRRLEAERQLDACFYVENDGRYRASLFVDRHGLNGVFRVIPDQPPTIADIGLPPEMADVATLHQGIVIVTGPSGCGKSTTLAAFVNLFNDTRRAHILMLEDPVEFVHPFKNCLINQRDVGKHTTSYARALRAALREDPDVIVIGELRDPETVSLALTAAETGHVVLTTLNATTAAKAVERIINSFPADEQPQIRESFAGSLKLILAQALVPAASGVGRVGCFEILKCTQSIATLIRDNKSMQIPSQMQIGGHVGMRRLDDALMALVREGKVTAETAYLRATSKEAFAPLVSAKFLEETLA